jgi:selenocysteine lyase/cysteine desulfurase
MVARQFLLAPGLIVFNAANLCPAPHSVVEMQARLTREIDANPSSQNRSRFGATREGARGAIAEHFGAEPAEIAITRNTTEGANTVVQGLGLKGGDEVVIWNENHACNNQAWKMRAERDGFTVIEVATPSGARTADDLVAPFAAAMTERTRAVGLTCVSNQTGTRLPIDRICALARDRGAASLVDGVQAAGAEAIDLRAMGCDFFAASAHKWMTGPREVGFLFIRRPWLDRLQPAFAGVPWGDSRTEGPRQFEMLGQRDDAAVASVIDAIALHRSIGADRIEARVRALATALVDRLSGIDGVDFGMPLAPELRLGVVTVRLPGADSTRLAGDLYDRHRIACAAMAGRVRLSPHLYNTMDQVERVAEALTAAARP